MGLNVIDQMKSYARQADFDFHAYFRNRCLRLQQSSSSVHLEPIESSSISAEFALLEDFRDFASHHIDGIRKDFLSLLMLPESARILWLLQCSSSMSDSSRSILSEICPSLAAIEHTTRGGPNLYKLSGWVIHVLIGYSTVTYFLRRGELPRTIDWPPEVRHIMKHKMKPIYESLDTEEQTILHVSVLGHDIGVAVDITNHEIHGIPLIPAFLRELNIDRSTLKQKCSNLSFADFVWAIQAVTRFHTFVNRVAIEYSKEWSAVEIAKLVDSASAISWRTAFLKEKFARILFLLGVGDLIAVDDILLNERKMEEMTEGYETVVSILSGNLHVSSQTDEGHLRFTGYLGDQNQKTRKEIERLVSSFGYDPDEFFTKFYRIREFNFALSLVRYLPSAYETVLVFLIIFRFIDEKIGSNSESYWTVRIIFDHVLDVDALVSCLREFSAANDLHTLRFSGNSGVCDLGNIKLTVSKGPSENIIHIRRGK